MRWCWERSWRFLLGNANLIECAVLIYILYTLSAGMLLQFSYASANFVNAVVEASHSKSLHDEIDATKDLIARSPTNFENANNFLLKDRIFRQAVTTVLLNRLWPLALFLPAFLACAFFLTLYIGGRKQADLKVRATSLTSAQSYLSRARQNLGDEAIRLVRLGIGESTSMRGRTLILSPADAIDLHTGPSEALRFRLAHEFWHLTSRDDWLCIFNAATLILSTVLLAWQISAFGTSFTFLAQAIAILLGFGTAVFVVRSMMRCREHLADLYAQSRVAPGNAAQEALSLARSSPRHPSPERRYSFIERKRSSYFLAEPILLMWLFWLSRDSYFVSQYDSTWLPIRLIYLDSYLTAGSAIFLVAFVAAWFTYCPVTLSSLLAIVATPLILVLSPLKLLWAVTGLAWVVTPGTNGSKLGEYLHNHLQRTLELPIADKVALLLMVSIPILAILMNVNARRRNA